MASSIAHSLAPLGTPMVQLTAVTTVNVGNKAHYLMFSATFTTPDGHTVGRFGRVVYLPP